MINQIKTNLIHLKSILFKNIICEIFLNFIGFSLKAASFVMQYNIIASHIPWETRKEKRGKTNRPNRGKYKKAQTHLEVSVYVPNANIYQQALWLFTVYWPAMKFIWSK